MSCLHRFDLEVIGGPCLICGVTEPDTVRLNHKVATIEIRTSTPDFALAMPLPPGFAWCASCQAAVNGCKHRGGSK